MNHAYRYADLDNHLLELNVNMPLVNFSRIVIIQSLFPDDEFTGTKLHEDLETLNAFHDLGLDIDLVSVHKSHELFEALSDIACRARKDSLNPLIHLEIHGSNDATGLVLSSKDYVSWKDIKAPLTEINVACKLNLIVILAVCYGAHLMQVIQPTDRAPCWGLIGPTEKIESGLILKSFYEFYRTLIETGSGYEAIKALTKVNEQSRLNSQYNFTNAEYFFKTVYLRYKEEECTSDAISRRARRMYRKLKKEQGGVIRSIGQLKRHLVKSQEEYFYKYILYVRFIRREQVAL